MGSFAVVVGCLAEHVNGHRRRVELFKVGHAHVPYVYGIFADVVARILCVDERELVLVAVAHEDVRLCKVFGYTRILLNYFVVDEYIEDIRIFGFRSVFEREDFVLFKVDVGIQHRVCASALLVRGLYRLAVFADDPGPCVLPCLFEAVSDLAFGRAVVDGGCDIGGVGIFHVGNFELDVAGIVYVGVGVVVRSVIIKPAPERVDVGNRAGIYHADDAEAVDDDVGGIAGGVEVVGYCVAALVVAH